MVGWQVQVLGHGDGNNSTLPLVDMPIGAPPYSKMDVLVEHTK